MIELGPIKVIKPENREHWLEARSEDVTSTESAALYGMSPWTSLWELWHRHNDRTVVEIEETERMFWGDVLEPAIAKGIGERHGLQVSSFKDYLRRPEIKMGSSFDFSVDKASPEAPEEYRKLLETKGPGLLEIKNVDGMIFRGEWPMADDGELEAPLHIEIQVQHQMAVSGREWALIGALVGGNQVKLITRERDPMITKDLVGKVQAFWKSIETGDEPQPDWIRDAEAISKMYGFAEPGKVYDGSEDEQILEWASQYKRFSDQEKEASKNKKAVKAQIIKYLADAGHDDVEKILGPKGEGFSSITMGYVGPAEVSYTRDGYRQFRVNWPRKKKGSE